MALCYKTEPDNATLNIPMHPTFVNDLEAWKLVELILWSLKDENKPNTVMFVMFTKLFHICP